MTSMALRLRGGLGVTPLRGRVRVGPMLALFSVRLFRPYVDITATNLMKAFRQGHHRDGQFVQILFPSI
jgi:hypothetical protein